MGRIYFSRARENHIMKIQGMPETFWVVISPTDNSDLGDICFKVDFRTFALQVRGGLDIEEIIGIYADDEDAKDTAMKLLAARNVEEPDSVAHPSPWPEWFASQDDNRSVWICDKTTEEKILVEPSADWGRSWAWNISEDGTGIVMRRVK